MLPWKDMLIPVNSKNREINCDVMDSTVFRDITVAPAQMSYPSNGIYKPKYYIDSSVYRNNTPVPRHILKVEGFGKMRGNIYAKVLLSPFKYYPSDKRLVYYDKIRFITPDVNYVAQKGMIYPGITIITDSSYMKSFGQYIKLKKIEGYSPNVRSTEFIYENYSGTDKAERIRNYIRTLLDSGVQYILLAGNVETVPTRYAFAMASGEGWWYDSIPTDYYYGDVDGTWNANHNSVFGEVSDSVDMLPDFYVGRISFDDISQLDTILKKIRIYETGEYTKSNCSVLANAGFLDSYTDASVGLDTILHYFPSDFKKTKLYDGNGEQVYLSDFIDSLDSGYDYLIHSNHGNKSGFVIGQNFFSYYNADTLSNLYRAPTVIYTTSCISAAFDVDCMAKHFLTSENGGGFYVGNARFGWYIGYYSGESSTDRMQRLFFKNLFAGGDHTIGELVAKNRETFAPSASTENTYRWMEYNLVLMGDPSTYLRTDSLRNLRVSYNCSVNGNKIFVSVSKGRVPLQGAVVSVFKGDSLISRGVSDVSGHARIMLQWPYSEDILYVYKNNFHLYSDTIKSKKIMSYAESFIKDGNDNNINPMELDTLNIVVNNQSDSTIRNTKFFLGNYGNFISEIDSIISVDSILPGEEDTLKFRIKIGNCTDSVAIFNIKEDNYDLRDSIRFKITRGDLVLSEKEYGVSFFPSLVTVKLVNRGNGYLSARYLHLESLDPLIRIYKDSVLLSDMYPNDSTSITLGIDTVATVIPNSIHRILVDKDTLFLLYSWDHYLETVDSLHPFGWQMYGIAHVSSKRWFSPPYSFRFGVGEDSLGYYTDDSLISPWIRSSGKMVLNYKTWFSLQAGWDFALVFVGRAGDWSLLDSYSGMSKNWTSKTDIFDKYPAGDSFRIKFVASTYNQTGYEGWYIDNIDVFPYEGATGISPVIRMRKDNTFKVINNMSSTYVNCLIPDNFELYDMKIINITGRRFFPKIVQKNGFLNINIKSLPTGIYIIEYRNSTNRIIKI